MANYKKSKKRSYSIAEKKSWKRGFLAGLFSSKRTTKNTKKVSSVKQKNSKYKKVSDIPFDYQHNVLFADENYSSLFRSLANHRDYAFGSDEHIKETLSIYKRSFGDKKIKDHYGI